MIINSIVLFLVMALIFYYLGSLIRVMCINEKINLVTTILASFFIFCLPIINLKMICKKEFYEYANTNCNLGINRKKFIIVTIMKSIIHYDKLVDVAIESLEEVNVKTKRTKLSDVEKQFSQNIECEFAF